MNFRQWLCIIFLTANVDCFLAECVEEDDSSCAGYCFGIVKPILKYLPHMQNELKECKDGRQMKDRHTLDNSDQLISHGRLLVQLQSRLDRLENELLSLKRKSILDSYTKIGQKYYYIEHHDILDWFEAKDQCQRRFGHLANIVSFSEWDDVRKKLSGKKNYWVDINDQEMEGVHLSNTSGKNASILIWGEGEPNNGDGSQFSENCVNLHGRTNFYYNDMQCSSQLNFICEAEMD